jgi:hypothetical protein
MDQTLVVGQRWALLVDPAAAHSVIERISKLELPRRTCRPLDHRAPRNASAELAAFDATIDATVEAYDANDVGVAESPQVSSCTQG